MDLFSIASKLEDDGPRNVLPDLERKRTYHERRQYVEDIMIDLMSKDELYLTELMYHGPHIKDLVGDVLLGFTYIDGTQVHQPVDTKFHEHRVKIVPVKKDDKVEWKAGRKVTRKTRIQNRAMTGNKPVTIDEPILYSKDHDSFSLVNAYRIIKQAGVPVKMGVSRARKATKGNLVVEVPPWVTYGEDDKRPASQTKKAK